MVNLDMLYNELEMQEDAAEGVAPLCARSDGLHGACIIIDDDRVGAVCVCGGGGGTAGLVEVTAVTADGEGDGDELLTAD